MKTVLSMLAMGTAMIATSAMAQDTTGTVNINMMSSTSSTSMSGVALSAGSAR